MPSKTKGKPCSCPPGRECSACTPLKAKKSRHVHYGDSKHIPVTKTIKKTKTYTTYRRQKPDQTDIHYETKTKPIKTTRSSQSKIHKWYRQRKTVNDIMKEYKKEKKCERELDRKLKLEKKKEIEQQNKQIERERKELKKEMKDFERRSKKEERELKKVNKECKKRDKPRIVKEEMVITRPTKRCLVKKYNKLSLQERCSNCCYRLCCQFYFCISCALFITLLIIV